MSPRGKSERSKRLIEAAHGILEAIQPATVRAVCYQLFNQHIIRSMAKSETNRVSTQLRDAREADDIPWDWIVDETREPERISAWEDPGAYVRTIKRAYRKDRWVDQPCRIEVWSEKGTVRGTVAPVLSTYGVTFRVMHGYGSATAIHQAAEESLEDYDRPLTAFYIGDWDPSGLHMSEVDLPDRIEKYDGEIDIERVALQKADCTAALPWFPAGTKRRDPRYRWYVAHYGDRCWELDALSPVVLRDRVEKAIIEKIDPSAWGRAEVTERAECESLMTILNRWPKSISGQASK